ncbi:odorant receptor 46a-like [Zophobas morio]|uniref:odorant receptor 46a-like n=1 Tax=Zophobas morio TaxID=2755281 RepID=UPI0030831E49
MEVQKKFCWKITIQPNILVLQTFGFWPKDYEAFKLNFYAVRTIILVIIFFPVALLTQATNLFFVLDDLIALTGTIYMLLIEILCAFKIYYLSKHMSIVKTLMRMLNDDLFQPRDVNQVALVQPNLDLWKTTYIVFMIMALGGNLFWAAFPLLDKANEENRLPSLAWYPYNTNVSPFYEITYTHQVLTYTYICFTHINIDTFIAALNTYIYSQFDILCDNLRKLHFGDNVKANLVKCIKHHWLILRFAEKTNRFFESIIMIQFLISVIIMGVTLFQITIVVPFSTEFLFLISYGVAIVTQIFMYCWFGNEVQVKSNNLSFAIYESKWPDFSKKIQKHIWFFMSRSQTPLRMSALNVFYLSLESFMAILKTSWSYFALLQQVNS